MKIGVEIKIKIPLLVCVYSSSVCPLLSAPLLVQRRETLGFGAAALPLPASRRLCAAHSGGGAADRLEQCFALHLRLSCGSASLPLLRSDRISALERASTCSKGRPLFLFLCLSLTSGAPVLIRLGLIQADPAQNG